MPQDEVLYLEHRGNAILYHWFMYIISGLYNFKDRPKPIKFNVFNDSSFQRETFELLKPDYEYVDDISGCKVISSYGAPLVRNDLVEPHYYTFVRELILTKNNLAISEAPKRLIYISRNKSHLLQSNEGNAKRQIVNEQEVFSMLQTYGFEYISLEPLTLKEKIKLFQEAALIVTPNGGALTMALFAHTKTAVIELHDAHSPGEDQYYNICKHVGISIERYTNVTKQNQNLFVHDIADLEHVVKKHMNI